MGRAGRRARPPRATRANGRAPSSSSSPVGAIAASTLSSAVRVGIRLNCWNTNPNVLEAEVGELAVSEPGEVASLELHGALGRAVERTEELSSVVLPDPLGPTSATNSPAAIVEIHRVERVTVDGPAPEEPWTRRGARRGSGSPRHSTCLSASAGRMRSRPPAAGSTRDEPAEQGDHEAEQRVRPRPRERQRDLIGDGSAPRPAEQVAAAAPRRRARVERRTDGAQRAAATTPSTHTDAPRRRPCASDSPTIWRTTIR